LEAWREEVRELIMNENEKKKGANRRKERRILVFLD